MSNNRNNFSHRNVRLYTSKQNSKSIISKFVQEFGYEEMFHECSVNKKALIIEESTAEIVYELESFSKKHENHEITIEYVVGKQLKITKTVRLESGKTLEIIENSPKNNNKPKSQKENSNQQNKPQQNKPQPSRKINRKDNNFQKQRTDQNQNITKNALVENKKKIIIIEDTTQKKNVSRNLKFNNNAA